MKHPVLLVFGTQIYFELKFIPEPSVWPILSTFPTLNHKVSTEQNSIDIQTLD